VHEKVITSKELLALHNTPAKSRPPSSEGHEDLTAFTALLWPPFFSVPAYVGSCLLPQVWPEGKRDELKRANSRSSLW